MVPDPIPTETTLLLDGVVVLTFGVLFVVLTVGILIVVTVVVVVVPGVRLDDTVEICDLFQSVRPRHELIYHVYINICTVSQSNVHGL